MSVSMNPVIGREVTERLRGLRAFVVLSVFVQLLTLTAFLVFEGSQAGDGGFDLAGRTQVGRLVFESVVLIMTVLVLFFVPGLTAGAIAGERERQTLATLQVTLLRPRSILLGKIVAALAYLVLLVVAALPVLAVAYLLGGIRVSDIVRGVVAVTVVAVLVATMVVAVSTFARRVQTATVLAYGFTALLVIAGPVSAAVAAVLDARTDGVDDPVTAPAVLLTTSPMAFVADVATSDIRADDGPLSALRTGLDEAWESNASSWFALFPTQQEVDAARAVPGPDELGRPDASPPAWLLSAMSMTVLAGALFWAAVRRLRTPAELER